MCEINDDFFFINSAGGGWGDPVRRSLSQPEQESPTTAVKRPRSPSLSEDSDENIPKAYR